MILEIEKKRVEPDIVVLGFKGRITLGRESQQIETMVKELVNQRQKKLVFDLSGVDYIDSSGLGILAFSFKAMKDSGGVLRLAGVRGRVQQLLKFTHLDTFLPVFSTLEQACRDFR